MCLEYVPLYRKESARRGYKSQRVMNHGPILRDISVSPLRHERAVEIILQVARSETVFLFVLDRTRL